jgi:hypothetical protein
VAVCSGIGRLLVNQPGELPAVMAFAGIAVMFACKFMSGAKLKDCCSVAQFPLLLQGHRRRLQPHKQQAVLGALSFQQQMAVGMPYSSSRSCGSSKTQQAKHSHFL